MVKLQKTVSRSTASGSVGHQCVDSSLFRLIPLQLYNTHGCLLESFHLPGNWNAWHVQGGSDHYAELELGSEFMDEDEVKQICHLQYTS